MLPKENQRRTKQRGILFVIILLSSGGLIDSHVNGQRTLDIIARNGDPSPDGNSRLSTFLYHGNHQFPNAIHGYYTPALNDRGEVADKAYHNALKLRVACISEAGPELSLHSPRFHARTRA